MEIYNAILKGVLLFKVNSHIFWQNYTKRTCALILFLNFLEGDPCAFVVIQCPVWIISIITQFYAEP